MSNFMENYGKAIFVLVLIAILIAFASPIGVKIKTAVLAQVDKLASIGEDEIENRNPKNYESVDIEKSWTESHTGSYFFERVSSDKTNTDYNKWKSNNKGKNSTSAVSTFTIETTIETEYSFDWTVSSESSYDKLSITCNGTTIVNGVSGTKNGTEKITLKSGTNTLKATYSKDSSGSRNDDCATITLPDVKVSVCKNNQTGEISNHIYDKGKITKEPTCTKNGEKLFTCKNCGNTKIEVIEKLGHDFVNEVCTRCGYDISKIPAVDQVYCIYYNDGEMTISQNKIEPEAGRTVVKKGFYYNPTGCTIKMKTVRFVGAVKPKSCKQLFWYCENLTEIKNIENLYTNDCTNMSRMFYMCNSLTSIDVSGFDTSKVTDMSEMFSNCNSLTSLDVRGWNTSKVTNMFGMFSNCYNLANLDVSRLNTSSVTNMSDMFSGFGSDLYDKDQPVNLDLRGFDTSKVTEMSGMFSGSYNIVSLDVRGWNTSNVTDMSYMFYDCFGLSSLDLTGWYLKYVINVDNMFPPNCPIKTITATQNVKSGILSNSSSDDVMAPNDEVLSDVTWIIK